MVTIGEKVNDDLARQAEESHARGHCHRHIARSFRLCLYRAARPTTDMYTSCDMGKPKPSRVMEDRFDRRRARPETLLLDRAQPPTSFPSSLRPEPLLLSASEQMHMRSSGSEEEGCSGGLVITSM